MAKEEGKYQITRFQDNISRGRILTLPKLQFDTPTIFDSSEVYGPVRINQRTFAVAKNRANIHLEFADSGDSTLAIESYVEPLLDAVGRVLVPGFLWFLNIVIDGLTTYDVNLWEKIVRSLSEYGSVKYHVLVDNQVINLVLPDLGLTSIVRAFANSSSAITYINQINTDIQSKMIDLPVHKVSRKHSFAEIQLNMEAYIAFFLLKLGAYRSHVLSSIFKETRLHTLFHWFMNGPFTVNMTVLPIIGNVNTPGYIHEKDVVPTIFSRQHSSNADTTGHIAYPESIYKFTANTNVIIDEMIRWMFMHTDRKDDVIEFLAQKPEKIYAVLPTQNLPDPTTLEGQLLSQRLLEALHLTTPAVFFHQDDNASISRYEQGGATDGVMFDDRADPQSLTDSIRSFGDSFSRYQQINTALPTHRFALLQDINNFADDATSYVASIDTIPLFQHNIRDRSKR